MKRWSKSIAPVVFSCCLAGCAASSPTKTQQYQADAIRRLGEAYMAEQNYTMALSELLKAEKLDPEDYMMHQDLGIVYMAKGELETAVSHLERALAIKPDFAPARNNLGAAYLAMENWDAAIDCFKLLTKDLLYATPHFPLANLGKAYYEKKEFAQAEKYYRDALKMEPGFVNALYGLGRVYLSMGNVQKAAEYFQRSVEAAPLLAEAHFDLANTYRLLGNIEKAREGYQRVVELAPQSDIAREAKRELINIKR